MLSDQQALERVRQGDRESYSVIVSRYQHRLHRVAQRILHNDDDAQEVVQDSHIQALEHIDQFAGRSSVLTWLTRIVVNESFTRIRRRRSRPDWNSGEAYESAILVSGRRSPEEEAMGRELGAVVRQAADGLPAGYRLVFVLREVQELSTAEVAGRLGLTENCVKTRLLRAKDALRRHVRPHLEIRRAPHGTGQRAA
ncbi:MAG: sigma-70 family RNA polymerase sigma factor [Bryobacteraceae bacterium]